MINPRVYRAAFVPALLALIALLLSVNTAPPALQPPPSGGVGTDAIGDGPRPRGDAREAPMPNTVVALPGESERTVAVIAVPSADGAGDPATRALSELASAFQSARHSKTLLLASTEAGAGAAEATGLLLSHPAAERVEAVVALSGASGDEAGIEVLSNSAGPQSTSAQLVETARAAVRSETGRPLEAPGPLSSFFDLAFPSDDGPQAELIEDGADAVGLAAGNAGELNAVAFQLVAALDPAPAAPVHGPAAWIPLSGNLIPGWAFALLALALLLPSALAGVDALARTRRTPLSKPRDAIPPLVGLAAVIAVVGIWVVNPFLALLCVPVAHLWLLAPSR